MSPRQRMSSDEPDTGGGGVLAKGLFPNTVECEGSGAHQRNQKSSDGNTEIKEKREQWWKQSAENFVGHLNEDFVF